MGKKGPWMRLTGKGWIRKIGPDKWEGRLVENVKQSVETKRRLRRETGKRPSAMYSKTGSFQTAATLPVTVAMEMQDKCGDDHEKRRMFLRDHPEHLLVPEKDANLPPARSFFLITKNPLAKETPENG